MAGSPTPEKRKRQVHPKTRTGCKTCKIRKVKCDEMKPFCKRCTSTGRTCDGYPSTQPIQAHFLAPRSRSSTPLALTQQMNISIPGSSAEKRGFHYFVSHTASELSGYFNEEFWNVFVLRGCYDQGALRHAVVGIGALHEDFEHEGGAEGKERFAVDQYSKAITHLRQSLNQSNSNESPLTALISCVLFVCFDSLRGSFDSAMLHLKSGLRILKEIRAQIKSKSKRNGRVISKEEELVVEKYIAPLFVRLIVQAILYVDTRSNTEKMILARELSVEDSDYDSSGVFNQELQEGLKFENLEEAREKLNTAAGGLFRMFYICDGAKAMAYQPAIVHRLLIIHTSALAAWNTAFNTFMSIHTPSLNTKQIRGAALLKIHHTTLEIMRRSAPAMSDPRPIAEAANSAKTFRTAAPLFVSIVALSKSLITALEQDALKSGKDVGTGKTFSPDLGVVGPLYYVGTKCTVKEVRDEALALLTRWKGREGMWDSGVGSQLVSEFWDMEKRFGTRGYDKISNSSNGTAEEEEEQEESWFAQALRSDRVRLDLVDGKTWVWKYKRNGNVDDGIFEEDGVDAGAGSGFGGDGGVWVSLGGGDDRIDEEWDWSSPVPNYDVDVGFGDLDLETYLGTGMGEATNPSPPAPSAFHLSQANSPIPPLPEDWMGGDISILQDAATESWSMPPSLQEFDLSGLGTTAFAGPSGML